VIVDAHVTIGRNREVTLDSETLLRFMDDVGIDLALVSPPEAAVAVANREGNDLVGDAASRANGRLRGYAVASPWLEAAALEELRRARSLGAVALKLDPLLQGFDLLDGLVDRLLEFAAEAAWPVYVRTGSPGGALPLQLAWLAARHEGVNFVMGKSGATDFAADGPLALAAAPNVYADSAHVEWPTRFAREHPERIVMTTDIPFTDGHVELARVTDAGLSENARSQVMGGTMSKLLGL
jgi:predicted TIM-barrel fold metal-dependent hydrolase